MHDAVVDNSFVIALLSDNTLEIHNLVTQELLQVLHLTTALTPRTLDSTTSPPSTPSGGGVETPGAAMHLPNKADIFQPRMLIACSAGFPTRNFQPNTSNAFSPLVVPHSGSSANLDKVKIPVVADTAEITTRSNALGESTNPQTPVRNTRHASSLTAGRPSSSRRISSHVSTVPSSTLLMGRDVILGLCPLTLVAQADAYVSNGRIDDALKMLRGLGQLNSREKVSDKISPRA